MRTTSRLLAAAVAFALLGVPAVSGSSTAPASETAPRASLTVSATKPALVLGQSTRIAGVLRPRARGVTVALQRRFASGWAVLAAKKTNGQGEFGFRIEPTEAGIAWYRAVRLNRLGEVSIPSGRVQVTTYRWHNVVDLNTTEDGANVFDGPAAVGGTTYPRSIVLDSDDTAQEDDGPGFVVVDTTGRCAAFSTVLGALDGNTAGTIVRGRVTGDGEMLSDKTYAVGAFDNLVLDIRGFSQVRVDVVEVQQDVERRLGVGTPRMLCAFPLLVDD